MSSTFGGLNAVQRGLYAQQVSLDTVGHNISNANTQGYSRQLVDLTSASPETIYGRSGELQKGTGTDVTSIKRARDTLIDKQMWKETASLGYSQLKTDTLGKIEGIFQEPSDTGIQTVLNEFWTAWQTLAANASDTGARTVVRQRGVEVVDAIQHAERQLRDLVNDSNDALVMSVDKVNELTSQISGLNSQVLIIETNKGNHANDLRDRRDDLVDQLSKLTKISVREDANGVYTIQTGAISLVNSTTYTKLALEQSQDSDYGYSIKNVINASTGQQVSFVDGEIKAITEARDSTEFGIKAYLDKLSTISQFLLEDFNKQSRIGYGSDNSTSNNFFGRADGLTEKLQSTDVITTGTYTPSADLLTQFTGLTAADHSFSLSDGTNSVTISVDLGGAEAGMTMAGLVSAINTQTAVANVNIRASYDSDGDKFYLYNTGDSSTITIDNVGASDGENFLANTLKLDDLKASEWLSNLEVNAALFVGVDGLSKIAAKTVMNPLTITQTNPLGGTMQVTTTYTGATPQTYTVKIKTAAASGRVESVDYYDSTTKAWYAANVLDSSDGVYKPLASILPGDLPADPTPYSFQILSGALGNVTLSIDTDPDNTVGNEYTFSTNQGNAAGDNAVKLANRMKVDVSVGLGGASLETYYISMIGALGVQSQDSQRMTDHQKTLVSQITNWREATSGVNMDEEMTNMIRFQKAYNASARMITTMDEMLDKLINGTGVVGR